MALFVNSLLSRSFLIKFSSLSAPTKIEELTAGSDKKTAQLRWGCAVLFFFRPIWLSALLSLSELKEKRMWHFFGFVFGSHPICKGNPVAVRGQEETGRFRDAKRCVATGIEPGSQELASCAARPPQQYTTGPRHRAFDVFQCSCYTICIL